MTENLWTFARSFIVTVMFMPALINFLRHSKEQAVIRKLGPDHQAKAGTPSMGGVLFVLAAVISAVVGGVASEVAWLHVTIDADFGICGVCHYWRCG